MTPGAVRTAWLAKARAAIVEHWDKGLTPMRFLALSCALLAVTACDAPVPGAHGYRTDIFQVGDAGITCVAIYSSWTGEGAALSCLPGAK